ncbi:CYTH domain-containing protein [Alkalihalobacillus sp. MEB130]|uniref:CYTH domain-containing protein n=1 Tax=Alkalihalobacillus sp. MEB130 TaxID=2976704 RepID=UPI0028E073FB|nr:CYTH domain-containing protein [Alkalihalobacillus sp. MEB130]MDT8862744.1 CYTH domain-containing protein [Alkalihalobacillus sp. MEB130]
MAQEIEIEVKSMLSEESYNALLQGFHLDKTAAITQHNHYFETPSFALKAAHSGLRIREKNGSYTLTLKQPHEVGKLETHQALEEKEWLHAKKEGILPEGNVVTQLEALKVPLSELTYVGTLTTERIEINYNQGLLCFDKSLYFDQTDYELEFEGISEEHANSTLLTLLADYKLDYASTENKVRRFFTRKNQIEKA